jgi:hypothetical protein
MHAGVFGHDRIAGRRAAVHVRQQPELEDSMAAVFVQRVCAEAYLLSSKAGVNRVVPNRNMERLDRRRE